MAVFCCFCGRSLAEKEAGAVVLKDGQTVCKDCADQTRILYPFRYTKVLTESEDFTHVGKFSYHEKLIAGRRIDPLCDMTAEQFREAMAKSQEAAKAQAARYAGAEAVIETDHVRRFFPNIGSAENPKYGKRRFFGVYGRVVHGQLIPGVEVTVSHRDRDYSAKIEELQIWDGSSAGGAPAGKAIAGTQVILIFRQDMSFVYPGDMLLVR